MYACMMCPSVQGQLNIRFRGMAQQNKFCKSDMNMNTQTNSTDKIEK
jgi:hypothetical protein